LSFFEEGKMFIFMANRSDRRRKSAFRWLVAFELCVLLSSIAVAAEKPIVHITQIDSSNYPRVVVHVTMTDSQGNPLRGSSQVKIEIVEDGKPVMSQQLTSGWPVSSVLVLDRSGSMKGPKIEEAKIAAMHYVEVAPDSYQIAVIAFSGQVQSLSDFTSDKYLLRSRIEGLSAGGPTALQDAIASAINMLAGRQGRRAVLVLTDGFENSSKNYPGQAGFDQLLAGARKAGVTISTVGLVGNGSDVQEDYLRNLASTGGIYVPVADPAGLRMIFERSANLLAREQQFEFRSSAPDGRVGHLTAEVTEGTQQGSDQASYVVPEFIPDLKGHVSPYFAILMALLLIPVAFSKLELIFGIRRFRSSGLKKVTCGSRFIGLTDPNSGASRPFQTGDVVVVCPACTRPHHVRSWRNNLCACMYEPLGKGKVCYRRLYPAWARRWLDAMSGGKTTSSGRVWLCRCSGDKDGY
jgi:hypothetical protein